MSTWALFGLVVVVVLVAVGIAGFLRWGRSREDDAASSEGERPRTVADLVDRRALGLDDGPREPAPDPSPPADEDAQAPAADEEPTGGRAAPGPDDGTDDGADEESEGTGRAVDATTPVPAVRPREERPRTPAGAAPADDLGPSSSAPDITEAVGSADPTDELPALPRVTPDVSAGPVGPPWSRGFKDGKALEPVEPAPARRSPAPTPFVRRRAVVDPAARAADEETTATGSGPDSSAPDISTPVTGVTSVRDDAATGVDEVPAAPAADAGPAGSPAPVEDTAPSSVDADPTDADADPVDREAADADSDADSEDTDDAVDQARPVTPQSRAPFDPDLVRRVTALPSERTSVRAPADPDTEREFREARDRISAPHTWASRVPEQAGAPEPGAETPPVSRIPSIGLAATGARAPRDAENPEPPPRPAPRVLRSVRPGSAPRHLAPSPEGTSASGDDTVEEPTHGDTATGDTAAPAGDADTAASDGPDRDLTPGPATPGPATTGEPPTGRPATEQSGGTAEDALPGDAAPDDTAPGDTAPEGAVPGEPATADASPADVPLAAVAPVPAAPDRVTPDAPGRAPRDQDQQDRDPQDRDPAPTIPERPEAAPEAEETTVHAGPTTAIRPDRAEDVSLSVLRTGPAPSPVVPDTAPQDVEVRVVDATDGPLPGADVALRDRAGAPIGSATTGTGGTAHVAAPGAGTFVVVARLDGYLPGVATCTVGDDDATTTLRLTAAAAVHGSAPAGTGVVLSQDGEPVASATAAADGTYRLTDLEPGRHLLTAGEGPGVEVVLTPGGDERQDLTGS
ncbi:carboxypeptidase regulatory-like domain-containing protein [Pseudonocardia sp. ICBG1293]|uniref:carboxypeptidase regulatory-like domain-containing protein n=1 Tax=Pseudonocardia sp. ICBG1293 TaxID=2844382 RepID=UPI001CCA42B1|nr:carboxypeptidase regulatory-like domain-containing protein [Pseudonocardia sp. ICBG1293]